MQRRNLAVLAVDGSDSSRIDAVAEARRGLSGGGEGTQKVFAFTSPTDAVLVALEVTRTLDLGVSSGVAVGEVGDGEGGLSGRAVDAARSLAARAARGQVLMTEAVYLAMNRVEVSAAPTNLEPSGAVEQRIYRAEPSQRAAADEAAAPAREGALGRILPAVLLVAAFAGGFALSQGDRLQFRGLAAELGSLAEDLARNGQHREASQAFLEAYRKDPGRPIYEARFRETLLQASRTFERAGRLDAAFRLLAEGASVDPFRPDLEARLVEVMRAYAEALLQADSTLAYAEEEKRFLAALPLREQEIRDMLVGLKAEDAIQEWRAAKGVRARDAATARFEPLYKESPENPHLNLVDAERFAAQGRQEVVLEELSAALSKRPEWRTERAEIPRILVKVLTSMETAYHRRSMGQVIDFCLQRLPDQVEPVLAPLLRGDAIGARVAAFRFLGRRGKIGYDQEFDFHVKNLQGLTAMGSRESPLEDETLVEEAIRFAKKAKGEDRRRMLTLLDSAARNPKVPSQAQDEIRRALGEMGAG